MDRKDASQLTDCQCIGSQGKIIDLNVTTSSNDYLSLLLLDVSPQTLPGQLSLFARSRNISLRVHAKLVSLIRSNGVIPIRKYFATRKAYV
jgi:hypothetical protein